MRQKFGPPRRDVLRPGTRESAGHEQQRNRRSHDCHHGRVTSSPPTEQCRTCRRTMSISRGRHTTAPRVLGPSPEVLGGPPSTRQPVRLAGDQPSRIKRQRQYRIVQTGIGLRRSHLRNAISLASMMFQLRPTVVPPTPPARHTQAEASDIPVASRAAVTTSVARVALIIDSPTHSPSGHISAPGRRSLSLMLTGTTDFRPPRQLCHTGSGLPSLRVGRPLR